MDEVGAKKVRMKRFIVVTYGILSGSSGKQRDGGSRIRDGEVDSCSRQDVHDGLVVIVGIIGIGVGMERCTHIHT